MRFNPFDFRVASDQERRAITDRMTNVQLSELYALHVGGKSSPYANAVKTLFGQYAPLPLVTTFLQNEIRRRRQIMADEAVTPYLNWLNVTFESLPANAYMLWRRLFGESYALNADFIHDQIAQKPKFSRHDVVKVIRADKIINPSNRQVSYAALVKLANGSVGFIYRFPGFTPVSLIASTVDEIVKQIPDFIADGIGIGDALGQMAAESSMLLNPLRLRNFR